MKRIAWTVAAFGLLGMAVIAQDPPGQGRQGGRRGAGAGAAQFSPGRMVGPLLAGAADADKSGDVTAKEWTAFLDATKAEEEGTVNLAKLRAMVLGSILDQNADKKLTTADLEAMFKALDRDSDGNLSAEELAPQVRRGPGGQGGAAGGAAGRRGQGGQGGEGGQEGGEGGQEGGQGRQRAQGGQAGQGGQVRMGSRNRWTGEVALMAARAADADKSGDVTAEEWKELVAGFKANDAGLIDGKAVVAKLMAAPKAPVAEAAAPGRRGFGGLFQMLDRALDPEGTGSVKTEDLQKIFTELDKNGDKALQADEITPPRGRRGR
jgi:Ca2+-binding EF-hand superfamily protein